MSRSQVIRLKPLEYCHIQDSNENVTFVEVGPKTFTVLEHHTVVLHPTQMVIVPPRFYCIIQNPVIKDKAGNVVKDEHRQYKLRHSDEEVRLNGDPFPLYPGEVLYGKVSPLQVVAPNTALKIKATRDCVDENGIARIAGDEWLFKGPGTYIPRVEQQIIEIVKATVIDSKNRALRIRAKKEFGDKKTGEEWLVRSPGSYLPQVHEEIVGPVAGVTLTDTKALHLRAVRTFTDFYGNTRKAGEEWLVTRAQADIHIPDVYESVIGEVLITTLSSRQYCVVLDPYNAESGKNQLGVRQLRKGEASFFLLPGERLEQGIQAIHVLDSSEALLLRAREQFVDKTEEGEILRKPGDRWMVYGPSDYVPSVTVEVIERRKNIPLDKNEGVYVRDMKTGRVVSVTNRVYMLLPYEELWEKELSSVVERLINVDPEHGETPEQAKAPVPPRDKTRVVTYRIPHNSAVQIYDYKIKKAKVEFGPGLIMLDPDEQFTVLSLSGNTPKEPKQLNAIALLLGPRFSTDVVVVETADHARLSLKLSYNWHFAIDRKNKEQVEALFSVPDFIGDFCKAIASRVRGSVAQQNFDHFHKRSAELIRQAVFGNDENGAPRSSRVFQPNNLVVTGIDIQSVEPVDSRTRDALQKSVQLAIEITTKSQEAAARHEAERREQSARGRLDRQKIEDEAKAEEHRNELLQLQAKSAAVETTGHATAVAKGRSQAAKIVGEAAVTQAQFKAEAQTIKSQSSLETLKKEQEAEIEHQRALNTLEIEHSKKLAEIEAKKFDAIVNAIGTATLKNVALAGPDVQKRLLQALGIKNVVLTDSNAPINLINGQGLIQPH